MGAIVITTSMPAEEGGEPSSCDPLQDGYELLGSASAPMGTARWCDTTYGESYGDGRRFDHEETATMAKIPSKTK